MLDLLGVFCHLFGTIGWKVLKFVYLPSEDTVIKPKVLLHNVSKSAFALHDDNGKENAQSMNHKLCHRFTLRINKQYFTSLKLSFGILVNIFWWHYNCVGFQVQSSDLCESLENKFFSRISRCKSCWNLGRVPKKYRKIGQTVV